MSGGVDEKTCGSCGRRIEWRRKWADDWDQVRWCSDACHRRKIVALGCVEFGPHCAVAFLHSPHVL